MSKEAGVHMSRSPLELELQAVVGTGNRTHVFDKSNMC